MRERYGAPFVSVHRGQLQLLLHRRALALGVTMRLGEAVKSIDAETAVILLQSRKTYRGDRVVGADGLWSVCRESLLGHKSVPEPTGDLAYRIILELDEVPDADLQKMIQRTCMPPVDRTIISCRGVLTQGRTAAQPCTPRSGRPAS